MIIVNNLYEGTTMNNSRSHIFKTILASFILTVFCSTASASSMNTLLKNKWLGLGAKNAEVLPSALNKCKLKMKTNSVVCTTDKIEKTTKIAELIYVTEAEISNFKGKGFTISFRRNYTYVMGTDLDDPDAPLPKEQLGWEKAKTVLTCKIAGGAISCMDQAKKEVQFSKL